MRLIYLKYLYQEINQIFKIFNILNLALGGSFSPGFSSKRPLSNKLY